MKKVLGIGNALVDVLVKIDSDKLLDQFDLPKGSMQLVDKQKSQHLLSALAEYESEVASGGSAANTINGLAYLGVDCGYIGKIHDDEKGGLFRTDMEKKGIKSMLLFGQQDTGVATTLISEDSQRTFATYLGAAVELVPEDLKEVFFKGYDIFHIEGYLVQNHELIERAVVMAHQAGLKVSMDLASYNIVEENLDFLKALIRDYVDIVFANEEESKAFTGFEPQEALQDIASQCELAVVKVGADGSLVKTSREEITVSALPARPIDTTGAGDLYASGFLYGYAQDLPLAKCAKLGSLLAANVIEVVGPKMNDDRWESIKNEVTAILES